MEAKLSWLNCQKSYIFGPREIEQIEAQEIY